MSKLELPKTVMPARIPNPWAGLISRAEIKSKFALSEDQLKSLTNAAHRAGVKFHFRKLPGMGGETYYCDPGEIRDFWLSMPGSDEEKRMRLSRYGG